ncbi:latrophilin 2 [Mytilus galloprovincialis]|uniref:Latrophilin 2 n=1 Tax=Mytilus galloprovincialis TaxID=29158 RepID=A0A8B6G2B7_MYTGA|nr:latrophilin 2 [Mytilus galloprovincialis]
MKKGKCLSSAKIRRYSGQVEKEREKESERERAWDGMWITGNNPAKSGTTIFHGVLTIQTGMDVSVVQDLGGTQRCACVPTAIDSRFVFEDRDPIRYTLLLGKAFPRLDRCTIAFWIQVGDNRKDSTVMSYQLNNANNQFNHKIFRFYQNNGLYLRFWKNEVNSGVKLNEDIWTHIVWTWDSSDGSWTFYQDGDKVKNGRNDDFMKAIPGGGEFVLGQAFRQQNSTFNSNFAFVGGISHLNIWNDVKDHAETQEIHRSCTYMYCGNVVQWADFRIGTRGAMRMRWPSGIYEKECFSDEEGAASCNKHCSDVIGAQCNEEIVENIVWKRTPAVNTIAVQCPGNEDEKMEFQEGNATRRCNRTEQNEGIWNEPYIDHCISEELRDLKFQILESLLGPYIEEISILEFADELLNHTAQNIYTNPIDIATVIDLLEVITNTQAEAIVLDKEMLNDGDKQFERIGVVYPTVDQTNTFSQMIIGIVDNLLSSKNGIGWNKTKPAGVEADHLLSVMKRFADIIAKSLEYHFQDRLVKRYEEADVIISKENIDVKDINDGMSSKYGSIELLQSVVDTENISAVPGIVFLETSSFRYRHLARYLPTHEYKSKNKEDNVNTPVIAVYIHANGGMPFVNNLSTPIILNFPILNSFNISNPECVRVRHEGNNGTQKYIWTWLSDDCKVEHFDVKSVVCHCRRPGVFAATTDMYNVNWDKGYRRPILMNVASYLGCLASALMCLATLVVHLYYKTTSCTASLHKNLSVSIIFSQLFMCGIDLYDYKIVCQISSVLLHYFFLSTYSWLMNEAFNLYIVITYSAHSHGELNESGGQVRYYFLGWVIPGILVGAFIGSQGDGYYAKDMCWVDWDNLWLFCGPAVGIIAVNIMVMIFTAKEQNENSYTKSEKTNKIITSDFPLIIFKKHNLVLFQEPLDKIKLTKRSPQKSTEKVRKRKPKIEASTDEEIEGSDCEMITTV